MEGNRTMTVLVKALLIAPVLRIDAPPDPKSPTVPALQSAASSSFSHKQASAGREQRAECNVGAPPIATSVRAHLAAVREPVPSGCHSSYGFTGSGHCGASSCSADRRVQTEKRQRLLVSSRRPPD